MNDFDDDNLSPLHHHTVRAEAGTPTPVRARSRVLPIILVPGTMGSRLCHRNEQRDLLVWNPFFMKPEEAWGMAPARAEARRLLADASMRLDVAGDFTHLNGSKPDLVKHYARAPWLIRNSYELVYPSYAPFLQAMVPLNGRVMQKGWRLYVDCCGYDWRISCRDAAKRFLKKRVEEVMRKCGGERPILVAHSMGGIVCRSYLHEGGNPNNIRALFLCGSPNLGATKPYHYLKDGIPLMPGDPAWDPAMMVLGIAILRQFNKAQMTDFCRGFPSLYQLVARQLYVEKSGSRPWSTPAPPWLRYNSDDTDLHPFEPLGANGRPPPWRGETVSSLSDTYRVMRDTVVGLIDRPGSVAPTLKLVAEMERLDRSIFETTWVEKVKRDRHGKILKDSSGRPQKSKHQKLLMARFHRRTAFIASVNRKTHVADTITLNKVTHDALDGNTFHTEVRSVVDPRSGDEAVPKWSSIPPHHIRSPTTHQGARYKDLKTLTAEHGNVTNDPVFIQNFSELIFNMLPDLNTYP